MLSTNKLVPFVHINSRHIAYAKQLGVELSRIREGQEGQPCVIAFEFFIVISGWDSHRQFIMVLLLTPVMSYFAPHAVSRFINLVSSLTSQTGRAHSVIDR